MQDLEIRQLILEGHATYELSRPINLYAVWFSRMVAMRLCPISIRGSVIFFLAVSFFNLQGPASFLSFLAFALSILQALLISSSLSLFLILALFWTVSAENAIRALNPIMSLLSGIMVPIPFFPEAARFWAYCLPFCGIIDTPFRIYLGHIPIQEVPCALLHQTLWIVLLVASGQKLLQRALFKVNRSG
ncbi:MAG: transporter permease [Chlamydiales bacterium]|nr:transporter permease [Chlamydiales bacterium]